jgi:uncharacterized protein YecE (DUF72 family)
MRPLYFLSYDKSEMQESRQTFMTENKILVGISSWADPELIASGFYPPSVKTPAERLGYYSSNFKVVEMDSSYHFLPSARNLSAWIEATPGDFLFDVKTFSLLTQHPTLIGALPRDMRDKAQKFVNKEGHLYIQHLDNETASQIWDRFASSIRPLETAGKLGLITFQFPSWFHPREENYEYIKKCREKLSGYRLGMEFRFQSWLDEEHRENTLKLLEGNGLALICVDEPQGLKSSVPALAEVTAPYAAVRFHGRNTENWERQDINQNEKYNYLYKDDELKEWAVKIKQMARKAEKVLVIFKNKHLDYAVKNARQMIAFLN